MYDNDGLFVARGVLDSVRPAPPEVTSSFCVSTQNNSRSVR